MFVTLMHRTLILGNGNLS